MRFSTTAATATWPLYGSPRASPYTSRASRYRFPELLDEDDPPELPDELLPESVSPSAFAVALPTMPSTVRPFLRWKCSTAFFVPEPKMPSTAPV